MVQDRVSVRKPEAAQVLGQVLAGAGCRRVAYRVSLAHGISSGRRSSLDFAPIPDVGFVGGPAPRAAASEEGKDSCTETEERQEEKQ